MGTWLDFKNSVKDFLTVDKDRLGLGTYTDKMLRQGVLDIQYFAPFYQKGNKTIYNAANLTTDGEASYGTLPEQAKPQDIWLVSTASGGQCTRYPLRQYPWKDRFNMICGNVCGDLIAIDPKGSQFYLYPKLADGFEYHLYWDGIKLEFVDGDTVTFDEAVEEAVAEFVSSKIERRVNKDLPLYESYMQSYAVKRQKIFVDSNERLRLQIQRQDTLMNCTAGCCGIDGLENLIREIVRCSLNFLGVTNTTATLRAFTTYCDGGIIVKSGDLDKDDGFGMIYIYRADSLLADNGGSVIKPDNIAVAAPGRYKQYL